MVRYRRAQHRIPWPTPNMTRITTPNGTRVRVHIYGTRRVNPCPLHAMHADYWVGHAPTYGAWPPTPELLREIGRWA